MTEDAVSARQLHILQITNHGLHEWQVTPGLPDTGGQNVYVNHLTEALIRLGHRVTIVNRGGYPHPLTGASRAGSTSRYDGRGRIVYLTDGRPEFVRKEDMADQVPALARNLVEIVEHDDFDLMISHYWDGALLGLAANAQVADPIPHVWVPHSLGKLKQRNVDPAAWSGLRIDERIDTERIILQQVDGVAATSAAIRSSLRDDYGIEAGYFVPPGVDQDRFRPRDPEECPDVWEFLAEQLERPIAEVQSRPLILEVSRTDTTKRKDVLIRAFAAVRAHVPDTLLAVTIDAGNGPLRDELLELIERLGLKGDVAVLGSVWDRLPCLYSTCDVYCTPSVMEGFGMSAQEAAASGRPVVSSDLVPFACEYLLGDNPQVVSVEGCGDLLVGRAAIVAPADDVDAFAAALKLLLTDEDLRTKQGSAARKITVPAFSWTRLADELLGAAGTED